MRRIIAAALLAGHIALLIHLTLFRFGFAGARPNFVPLRMIRHDIEVGGDGFRINFLGNLGVFAVGGFLLPTVLGRRTSSVRVVGLCLGFSLLIEILQWRSGRRVADVDDLILNAAGGWLGYLGWWAGRWWFAVDQKA